MSDAPTSSNEEDVMVNTISSKTVRGNVFAALDFDGPEAELAKAAIITRIERALHARFWSRPRRLRRSAGGPAFSMRSFTVYGKIQPWINSYVPYAHSVPACPSLYPTQTARVRTYA